MKHRDNDNSWVIPVVVAMLLIILSGANHDVHAAPWIEIHGLSKHSTDGYWTQEHTLEYRAPGTGMQASRVAHTEYTKHDYNEVNLGLGLMWRVNNHVEAGFGWFRNSYDINTLYTGADIHTDDRPPIRLGVSLAIVDGYQNTPASTNVMVLPNLTMRWTNHLRVKLGFIPGKVKVATVTLGVKF